MMTDLARDTYLQALAVRGQAETSLGTALRLQLRRALTSCGVKLPVGHVNLLALNTAERARMVEFHAEVQTLFASTLATYQGHFRVIEKLQKQLQQPLQQLRKNEAKLAEVKARFEKLTDETARQRMQGQLGQAKGLVDRSQAQVDVLQVQVDAEFRAAEADKPAFLAARCVEEYTRRLFHLLEAPASHWSGAQLVALQRDIDLTNVWNPNLR